MEGKVKSDDFKMVLLPCRKANLLLKDLHVEPTPRHRLQIAWKERGEKKKKLYFSQPTKSQIIALFVLLSLSLCAAHAHLLPPVPPRVQGLGSGLGERPPRGPRDEAGRRRACALPGPAAGGAGAKAGRRRALAVAVPARRGASVDLSELL